MRLVFTLIIISLIYSCNDTDDVETPSAPLKIASVDLSTLPQLEIENVVFKDSAYKEKPLLTVLKEAGINNIRLRLWVSPENKHSSFFEVKKLTKRLQNYGFTVMLSLHYSDEWADPGNQKKPKSWNNISFNALKDSVYIYSRRVASEIKPEFIQLGNEINNGFLKPEGDFWELPLSFVQLLNEANRGVKDADSSIKTIVHFAGYKSYFPFLKRADSVNYDFIGLSYYPWWHGIDTTDFNTEILNIHRTFKKPILFTETAYPFTFGWNDWTNNIVGEKSELIDAFKASEQGQAMFVKWLVKLSNHHNFIKGASYWEGAWIALKGSQANDGSPWENCALFDFENRANKALYELGKK
ncbi:MAG: glycosyl hydrolase 53 family protein [Bacteroidia bacterium]